MTTLSLLIAHIGILVGLLAHWSVATCGYASCDLGQPGMLNVHLISHTHDDVGWLKTVDQYYYGNRDDIQTAGVQYIISTVVEELWNNPERKFSYVEIAFFYRWWNQQSPMVQNKVIQLVNEGRLQFLLGGWSMNDEATTHYYAIIDQLTRGLRFLSDTFGECGRPLTSWQIDPFGHSKEQANLFEQIGYDSLYFMRMDYRDKDSRLARKQMEFLWQGSVSEANKLFTGVTYDTYCQPANFCFDTLCSDAPIMDDPTLHDMNVQSRVDDFFKYVTEQAKYYTTNHIMVPMGCDFTFQNALKNFRNMDKLIYYANQRQMNGSKINLLYSTPTCYTYAVNQGKQTYTTHTNDFFPYASDPHSYWTGYFTSRPALKGYVRQSNAFLQSCKQLAVLSGLSRNPAIEAQVDSFRRTMGVLQHHDAVSGTEKQHVTFDYAQRLAETAAQCQQVVSGALTSLITGRQDPNRLVFCTLLNISSCAITESGQPLTVVLYNPQAQNTSSWVRLPVYNLLNYSLTDPDGKSVPSQLVQITQRTINIPERGPVKANWDLVFRASIPAFGFSTYKIVPGSGAIAKTSSLKKMKKQQTFANEFIALTYNSSGYLSQMTNLEKSLTIPLIQNVMYYVGYQGDNSKSENRSSGAYIFRPVSQTATRLPDPEVRFVTGPLVSEVHQNFGSWATLVTRLYQGERLAETEWTIGPIPDDDQLGREVIVNYETNLKSLGLSLTDSNGRQLLLRQRDVRSYPFNQTESVAGNYYPVNSLISVGDSFGSTLRQLFIYTDRAQGGASIRDGQIELMVHRRTMKDDAFGVGEALKENGADNKGLIVRGKHYFAIDTFEGMLQRHQQETLHIFLKPTIAFLPGVTPTLQSRYSGLRYPLPPNVNFLTLDEWTDETKLVRLEHIFEVHEDANYSQPVSVNLQDIFTDFQLVEIEELKLGANQHLNQSQKLVWNNAKKLTTPAEFSLNPANITLTPMSIRTFKVTLQPRSAGNSERDNDHLF